MRVPATPVHREDVAEIADRYDAVVVGASFAGLAAAGQLAGAGRVLLVGRTPPGEGETSACGTLLAVLERLDALDALEQIHPTIVINAAGQRVSFAPAYPFATFDYRTLCRILAARLEGVELSIAPFRGVEDGRVLQVGDRRVTGRVLIDASGWRAVLVRALDGPAPDDKHVSIGIETRHGHGGCDLEFWARPPERPDGVFWAFPAGGHVREGVASYAGRTRGLRGELARFAHEGEFPARAVHGGVFPSRLRDPVRAGVFVVGDAAGQCLPLTGEGIRPALVWGQEAGRQARGVLEGRSSLEAALATYRAAVLRHLLEYRLLEWFQRGLLRLPLATLPPIIRAFASGPIARIAQRAYWTVADPGTLEVRPGVASEVRIAPEQCAGGAAAGAPLDCACDGAQDRHERLPRR